MSLRVGTAAISALVVALVLSGCSLLGIPDPGASASRTPTPTPAAAFALDCPAVVDDADLTAFLGADAKPVTDVAGITTSVAAAGPLALPAVGGSSCGWTHGKDTLTVEVLPHAADGWGQLAAEHPDVATPGADYQGGVSLGGDCALTPTVWCRTNVLVGGAWLAVDLRAAAVAGLTEAGFHGAVQRMLPTVTAEVSSAPAAATGAPLDCSADDLRAQMQTTYDLPAVTPMDVDATFRVDSAVLRMGGTTLCVFGRGDGGSGGGTAVGSGYLGSLSVLPAAPGVYDRLRAAVLAQDASAHSETITVKGEEYPALVWNGEVESTPFVSVDAVVGGRWIEFHSTDTDPSRALAMVQWAAGKL
ncbi:hypothetical protein IT072_14960 [Leifsonia sp. ZF2019]|uniref:hypothetical protein n=1 Tax=Leifsonia sp. ZF2019 TaxID=2781978 RepID=UPI001CC09856|nr:hypothetical protein [Leifsonia sp. ZF2019]UAJ78539.1 hypothetical protein IT072_14960 [Leifsonia sp. ZF2019]